MPCTPEEAGKLSKTSELVSTLQLQARFTKETTDRIDTDQRQTADSLHELEKEFSAFEVRVTVLEKQAVEPSLSVDQGRLDERVKALEKKLDELGGRRFSIRQGVLFVLLAAGFRAGIRFQRRSDISEGISRTETLGGTVVIL